MTDSMSSAFNPQGYQWLLDPDGHRWKVVGMTPVVAHLEAADGRLLNVGWSMLRTLLKDGGWREAEFEEAMSTPRPCGCGRGLIFNAYAWVCRRCLTEDAHP